MSVPQLLIILVIVALVFGTKRLKTIGGDLGGALKSFRKAMNTGETEDETPVTPVVEDPPKRIAPEEEKK
jgi:sec-independent protein translocase protein TatA